MHFVFMTRGIKNQVDIWKNFMQSQFFPWTRKNLKTGKDELHMVQGALRPIQLWEYIFPEEHMEDVLKDMNVFNEATKCHQGSTIKQKGILAALRKSLALDKIPDTKDDGGRKRMMQAAGVAVHPIGIKKDIEAEAKQWNYKQEML